MMPNPASPAPPTEASARWVDHERFVTDGSSRHAVVMDSGRARNTAPGPMEMVLRSLCACSATDVVAILKKARQPMTGLEVTASGQRAPQPPTVFTRIHVVYRVEGRGVDRAVAERAVALSQAKYCSVLATLKATATVTHELVLAEGAQAAAAPVPR